MTNQKTKKNLTWKLSEQLSGQAIAELVKTGVIKPEEARDILFGNPEYDKDKILALEELVKFLQNLVTELSKNRTTIVPFTAQPIVVSPSSRPYWNRYWGETNTVLSNAGLVATPKSTIASSMTTTHGTGEPSFYSPAIATGQGTMRTAGYSQVQDNTITMSVKPKA